MKKGSAVSLRQHAWRAWSLMRYTNGRTHDGKYLAKNNYHLNGGIMFTWAIIFLIVALVAAVFGFTGIAGAATNIAWILFVLGIILFVVFLFVGRGSTRR